MSKIIVLLIVTHHCQKKNFVPLTWRAPIGWTRSTRSTVPVDGAHFTVIARITLAG